MLTLFPTHVSRAVLALDVSLEAGIALPEISTLLNATVANGGKRLRPALLFLLADLFDVSATRAMPYARAAELLHAATLVHDDVVDEAGVRRGRPTVNARTSNAHAVLAGDLLLSRVIGEMASLGDVVALRGLSDTLEALVDGEWRQLGARGRLDVTREELEITAQRKTASLMEWCCWVPALLAGRDEATQARCRELGRIVGLAFQMKDDELDFSKSGEKPFAQDLHEGIANFLTVELLEADPALVAKLAPLLGRADVTEWPFTDAALEEARAKIRHRVDVSLARARTLLDELHLPPRESLTALRNLLGYLEYRPL